MNAPDYTPVADLLCRLDPVLQQAGADAVKRELPAAVTALRAVVASKRRAPLPEIPERGPVDDRTAWEGGGR